MIKKLIGIANILRRDSLVMTAAAGSGHPTSCLSCAEIISALVFHEMEFDQQNPQNPLNDQLILSKGHAAPIYYSALYRAGAVSESLLNLRKKGSIYQGHPIPSSFPFARVATGSLGQGLSVGAGMALASKMEHRSNKIYVLMGDSEIAEGSVDEAVRFAAHNQLQHLIGIVDVNGLGQTGQTMCGLRAYAKRFKGLGAKVFVVDGHDVKKLLRIFYRARFVHGKPVIILAKTEKGKGVSFLEGQLNWHGKVLSQMQLQQAMQEIPSVQMPKIILKKPMLETIVPEVSERKIDVSYTKGTFVATREAYGSVLVKLGVHHHRLLVLDGETSNSTFSELFKRAYPTRFVECYIAEQNMLGVAAGLATQGFFVCASSFAAFLSRAHDQLRMTALSSIPIVVCGSHAGISIGEDGPSQMGLDDIAMFRGLVNSAVLYPSDAVSTERLVESALSQQGIIYLRTSRPKTPVLYSASEQFPIGDFKTFKSSAKDSIVIVAAGITVHEALKAQIYLKSKKKNATVVDCYSVKPFNSQKFVKMFKGKKIIVVEDHYPQGGIGEMISASTGLPITHLAVFGQPYSAKPEELLKDFKIDAEAIIRAVLK